MPAPADRLAAYVADHRPALIGRLRQRLGSTAAAEDLLQDALLRALPRVPDLPEPRLAAWFARVLRNATVDAYRRRAAEERASATLPPDAFAEPVVAGPGLADDPPTPCGCAVGLLDALAPTDADLLRRLDLGTEPPAAAARRLGVARGTLDVRRLRARRRLRAQVERVCGACAASGCAACTCS